MMEPSTDSTTGYTAMPSAPVAQGIDPTYASHAQPPPHGHPQTTTSFPRLPGSDSTSILTGPIFILILVVWHFFWAGMANLQFVSDSELVGYSWLPIAWFFHTLCFLGVGFWAVADERPIAALAFLLIVMVSIFSEWLYFGLYFDHAREYIDQDGILSRVERIWKFSFAAAFLNHLAKYVTMVIMILTYRARGGAVTISAQRRNYNEIPGSGYGQ